MDPITLEKLYAIKRFKRTHFLQNLIQYSLTAFVLVLCVSMVCPSLCSSIKLFFVSLPNIGEFFVGPKFLFVVFNMIVIYLLGESKLMGSAGVAVVSSGSNIYDEYVKERIGFRRPSTLQGKERKKKLDLQGEDYLHGEEEEHALPADELNKRVEDFIARVNKQRLLEETISG